MSKFGFQYPSFYKVLESFYFLLNKEPYVNATQVSKKSNMSYSNMYVQFQFLEHYGYIIKVHTANKKERNYTLTDKGIETVKNLRGIYDEAYSYTKK